MSAERDASGHTAAIERGDARLTVIGAAQPELAPLEARVEAVFVKTRPQQEIAVIKRVDDALLVTQHVAHYHLGGVQAGRIHQVLQLEAARRDALAADQHAVAVDEHLRGQGRGAGDHLAGEAHVVGIDAEAARKAHASQAQAAAERPGLDGHKIAERQALQGFAPVTHHAGGKTHVAPLAAQRILEAVAVGGEQEFAQAHAELAGGVTRVAESNGAGMRKVVVEERSGRPRPQHVGGSPRPEIHLMAAGEVAGLDADREHQALHVDGVAQAFRFAQRHVFHAVDGLAGAGQAGEVKRGQVFLPHQHFVLRGDQHEIVTLRLQVDLHRKNGFRGRP